MSIVTRKLTIQEEFSADVFVCDMCGKFAYQLNPSLSENVRLVTEDMESPRSWLRVGSVLPLIDVYHFCGKDCAVKWLERT